MEDHPQHVQQPDKESVSSSSTVISDRSLDTSFHPGPIPLAPPIITLTYTYKDSVHSYCTIDHPLSDIKIRLYKCILPCSIDDIPAPFTTVPPSVNSAETTK